MRSIRPRAGSHREAAAHGNQAGQGRSVHGDCGALRLELLGPVRAWRGQRELCIGGPWRYAVLGMLAARDGHPVRRSELITGVWGTPPPADAAQRLHGHLAGLRQALAPCRPHRAAGQVLAASGPGYRLRLGPAGPDPAGPDPAGPDPAGLDPAGLDIAQLDRHVAQARHACTAGDLGHAVRLLDTALRLYRDVPLAGLPGPWAAAERHRLAELRLILLEERTELLLAMGRQHEAIPGLLSLTRAHPERERFLSQLMVALYRAGRRADALAQFDTARQLRGEPGPGLPRLRLQILTADTALMTVLPPGSGLPGGRRGGLSGLSQEAAAADRCARTAARPHAHPAAR
jgi:DNA-binding SARP family transcriptional activator